MLIVQGQIAAECVPQIGMIALVSVDVKRGTCNTPLLHAVLTEMTKELCCVRAECCLKVG